MTTYLGVLRAQAVAVPVNPAASPGELAWMMADSGARLVVADPGPLAAVREALATLGRPPVGEAAGLERSGSGRCVPPRLVVVGDEPRSGETTYDALACRTPAG